MKSRLVNVHSKQGPQQGAHRERLVLFLISLVVQDGTFHWSLGKTCWVVLK